MGMSERARGSAWLERAPDKREVRGSNPRGPILTPGGAFIKALINFVAAQIPFEPSVGRISHFKHFWSENI